MVQMNNTVLSTFVPTGDVSTDASMDPTTAGDQTFQRIQQRVGMHQ